MSVPKASVQAKVRKLSPWVVANWPITGAIVAAKGMLSTTAEAKAEIHNIMGITSTGFPPDIFPMNSAKDFNNPVSSSPPTQTNRPKKKSRVRQSTPLIRCKAFLVAVIRVSPAAIIPIKATDNPVWAWVTSKPTTRRKIAALILNNSGFVIASLGSGRVSGDSASLTGLDGVRILLKEK